MDRERQTLELLQLLGDEVAEAVLGRLQPERAEKLRTEMKADRPHISTIGRQREVLDEFECFFQFAMRARPPESEAADTSDESGTEQNDGLKDNLDSSTGAENSSGELRTAASSETTSASDGSNSDSSSSENSSESQNQNEIESKHSEENIDGLSPSADEEQSMVTSTPVSPEMTGDPLRDLQILSVHQVCQAVSSEQPRTTAILLSHLPAKMTGDILNLMKPDYQKLVMKELSKEQHAPAVLVERIARATFQRAQQLPPDPPDTRNHADRVAEVLRSVPKAGRRNMLAAIEEQDPELAKSLLTRIYRFDDISDLNKAVVQRVLGEVDSTNLTTALFGADEEIKDAIFANLSKRARQTIEEEMQFMTNVPESRIQQARDSIAEIIAKIDMESEG